jgi:HlyD family secretion protein
MGIYEVNGGHLRLCLAFNKHSSLATQRPQVFSIERGSGNILLELERYLPSSDERLLLERNSGLWRADSRIVNGVRIPVSNTSFSASKTSLQFYEGRYACFIQRPGDDLRTTWQYILDPALQPKTITFVRQTPEHGKEQLLGIYKFDGSVLTIAFHKGAPRPEKFESTAGSDIELWVLGLPIGRRLPAASGSSPPPGVAGGSDIKLPQTTSAAQKPLSSFRTAAVTRGDLAVAIGATGTIQPEEVVDVMAQVEGPVVRFGDDPRGSTDPNYKGKPIDYNSPVEVGTILAEIDPTLYKARRDQAAAGLDRAKANVRLAEAKLAQAKAEKTSLDVAEAAVLAAMAAVAENKTALELAETNLAYTVIKSPVKGVIVDRRVNVGQNVAPAAGAPSLFLIAKDVGKLQIWTSVNEADIGRITKGMDVHFTIDAVPHEVFRGKVIQVRLNATLIQNVVTYTVVVALENPDRRLMPYMTANVSFEIERHKDILKVPNAALRWFEIERHKDILKVPNAALRWRPLPQQIAPDIRAEALAAMSRRNAEALKDRHESSRLWIVDGDFVRPIPVVIVSTDGTSTAVKGPEIHEGMEVVIGERVEGVGNPLVPQSPSAKKGNHE